MEPVWRTCGNEGFVGPATGRERYETAIRAQDPRDFCHHRVRTIQVLENVLGAGYVERVVRERHLGRIG